jgi:hypothetical protein
MFRFLKNGFNCLNKIIKSNRGDQYLYRSNHFIHLSNLTLLRSVLFVKHDNPGFTESRLNCHRLYFSVSLFNGGRARYDISPFKTLTSCGNSSNPVF